MLLHTNISWNLFFIFYFLLFFQFHVFSDMHFLLFKNLGIRKSFYNCTKNEVFHWEFLHLRKKSLKWKTSFFVQCILQHDIPQRCIQDSQKHLKWRAFQQIFTPESSTPFLFCRMNCEIQGWGYQSNSVF